MSLCRLRDLNIVSDSGQIVEYPDLTPAQSARIIYKVLSIIKHQSAVQIYLDTNNPAGRTINKPYYELITYRLVRAYSACQN